jgi:predicted dehydrogenase
VGKIPVKINWGLIGCGDIARKRVAPALRDSPLCELISVSRARVDLAESFAGEFGAKKWFADWRDQIRDPEIDAVYIATPTNLHAQLSIEAAKAGKHVLCEKPMAMDLAECDAMIAGALEGGVKLGIAYYRHFYPVIHRVKEILRSGEVGQPAVAQINAFEFFDPPPSHPRAWLLESKVSGGGPLFDFGCHRVEVLLDLFGEVAEGSTTKANAVFQREVEDVATKVLKFVAGPVGMVTVAHSAREAQDTLHIFCSRGSLHVEVLNLGVLRVITEVGERTEHLPPAPNIHQPLIEDFAQAILEDRAPTVDGPIGRRVSALL